MLFKEKVLKIVKNIPKGKTKTYKQVAELAGSPCYRVIRSDGKIGGYNRGTKKKKELLNKDLK